MTVLEIHNLSKIYQTPWPRKETIKAVDDLNIKVEEGEIYGFLGPNGAGKTTTLMSIMGFLKPTGGHIKVLGDNPGAWKTREKMGFLPDNPMLYPFLTGYNALYIAARLFSMSHSEIKAKISALADELGMDRELRLQVRQHSRGMRQRIGLAQALLNDPDLLIMDEPMSGLDPKGRKMFREVIMRRRESGKTVFFSSHILADIEMICDRIGIINYGNIVYEDSMDNIKKEFADKRLEDIFMEKVGAI